MGRSPPDLSFEDYQPQYSRGGTEDPSSRIPPSHDNFIKLSMNATEWNFPVAWATDWLSQQILENQTTKNLCQ
ncbi:unnamed protein product [Rotaria sordida]|uniref:Uncharacterized protein n=1 Tax=Rotaria sordida TaxID=392033 RepID=A0A814UCZ5_9BILA|nr:unnamed protein product [Rotaria sordida]CAF1173578.1 unnamed protein product [Rotaria sordida]